MDSGHHIKEPMPELSVDLAVLVDVRSQDLVNKCGRTEFCFLNVPANHRPIYTSEDGMRKTID